MQKKTDSEKLHPSRKVKIVAPIVSHKTSITVKFVKSNCFAVSPVFGYRTFAFSLREIFQSTSNRTTQTRSNTKTISEHIVSDCEVSVNSCQTVSCFLFKTWARMVKNAKISTSSIDYPEQDTKISSRQSFPEPEDHEAAGQLQHLQENQIPASR